MTWNQWKLHEGTSKKLDLLNYIEQINHALYSGSDCNIGRAFHTPTRYETQKWHVFHRGLDRTKSVHQFSGIVVRWKSNAHNIEMRNDNRTHTEIFDFLFFSFFFATMPLCRLCPLSRLRNRPNNLCEWKIFSLTKVEILNFTDNRFQGFSRRAQRD